MAKLKIELGTGLPNRPAYINVVTNLFATIDSYEDFIEADPTERPDILQGYTGNTNWKITQLTKNGNVEAIDSGNCKIVGEKDRRRRRKRSTVMMPIPDERPSDFDYLAGYAQAIVDFYAAGQPDNAHRFLFGAMLLTRCR